MMKKIILTNFYFHIAEKRRVYDNRGNNPMHEDEYDYHNPFAGFAVSIRGQLFRILFNKQYY